MTDLDEILGAFEQALELERELGTRTVDCDRTLLVPMQQAAPAGGREEGRCREGEQEKVVAPASTTTVPAAPTRPPTRPLPPTGPVDFAFIAEKPMLGGAGELLDKMIAAMGYTRDQVAVAAAVTAVAHPPPARIYVVLGSEAFKIFAPGQRAALGLWTKVGDVPTVVTYSPARILAYFGGDAVALNRAKRQIWSDLKSALARIGKQPPARR